MKKYIFVLAFGAMLALTACGSGSTTTESNDPAMMAPVTDSTLVADSTAVPAVGGGVAPVEPTHDGKLPTSHEEVK